MSDPTPPAASRPRYGGGPAKATRRELQGRRGGRSSWSWRVAAIVVALVVVGGTIALVATSHGPTEHAASPPPPSTSTTVTPTATGPTCPLTGLPAPGGAVPQRPALAVKIGNYPADRPSAGLDHADIVFEEPVEGSITRLVAVFQCQSPPLVGDIRSAREPDVAILSQLSHPLFAHMGGINPILNLLSQAPIIDLDMLGGAPARAIVHEPGKVPPYNTFTKPTSMWALERSDKTPPQPIFQYSTALPAGAVAGSGTTLHIPFSGYSNVTWTWNPAGNDYLRAYSGVPDRLVDGAQVATTNVVAMTVQTFLGPWVENAQGAHEVEVTALGSGPVTIVRNGAVITGTWQRTSLTSPATFTSAGGAPITLAPGRTWVELVPQGIPVVASPGVSTASAG